MVSGQEGRKKGKEAFNERHIHRRQDLKKIYILGRFGDNHVLNSLDWSMQSLLFFCMILQISH